jgi:hypothetical protein
VGEVLVLGDDDRAGAGSFLPNRRVGRLRKAEREDVLSLASLRLYPARKRPGQWVVDEEASHDARRTT